MRPWGHFSEFPAVLGKRCMMLTAAAAALSLAAVTTLSPPAEARGGGFGAGVAVGVGAAIIGGALMNSQQQRSRPPAQRHRSKSGNRGGTKRSRSTTRGAPKNAAPAATAANSFDDGRYAVRSIKRALASLSFYSGSIDGTENDAYRSAVRDYQTSKRLVPTGALTQTEKELLVLEVELRDDVAELGPVGAGANFSGDKDKRLQRSLKILGHYDGAIDGAIGPGSKKAVRAYQAAIGAPATGILTPPEIDALALAAKESAEHKIKGIDSQYALMSKEQLKSLQGGKVAVAPAALTPAAPAASATAPAAVSAAKAGQAGLPPVEQVKADATVKRPLDVAVIIGNKDYRGNDIPDVDFGHRDAEAMKAVLVNELGFSQNNIIDARDAGQADLIAIFGSKDNNRGKVWRLIDPDGKSNVFVFYSGHGAPEIKSKSPYLMPVDAHPDTIELNGYPLEQMYTNLDSLEVHSVAVFLDACFSGGSQRGMLTRSASPVAVTAKMPSQSARKRLTVLAAAEGDQLASWDEKAGHGMFTGSVVEGLKGGADTSGDGKVTASELHEFVFDNVRRSARREFGRIQTPVLLGNPDQVLHE